jgi:hypothetical protein
MCCLALSAAFIGPRFALLLVWIFGDRVDLAFDSWFWPFLGLLFLPWTTLFYVFAWSPGGVDGADWIFVGLGLALDIVTYASRSATNRARQAY